CEADVGSGGGGGGGAEGERARPKPLPAIRIAADVYPAIIWHPLNTRITVAGVRPCGGGQRNASAYAPPRPEASTAEMPSAPIAGPPTAGPIARPSTARPITST